MAEILGEGFIQILPDVAQFNTLLQAEVSASLAAVEKQFAAAKLTLPAAANPLSNIAADAASIATTITQKTAPALQGLSTQFKSLAAIRTDLGAATTFNAIGQEAKLAGDAIGNQFVPALKGAGNELKNAGKSIEGTSTSLGGFQRQLLSVAKLVPVIVAGFSIKLFADFERASEEASAVFGKSSDEIINFAKGINTQFGLTSTAALKIATDFGDALANIGFSQQNVAKVSEDVTKRIADVAAGQGKSVATVANAFNLVVQGNSRGFKQLQVDISASDQAARAAQFGFRGTVEQLSDAQRAAVFLSLALDGTARFEGAAARNADNLTGSFKDFKATAGDAAVSIGRELAPAVTTLLGGFTGLISAFGSAPKILKDLAISIGLVVLGFAAFNKLGIKSVVTGVIDSLGALTAAFTETAAAEGIFAAATEVALGPVGLLIGAAGLLTAALFSAGEQAPTTASRVKSLGDTSKSTAEQINGFFAGIDFTALNANLDALQTKLDDAKAAAATPPPAVGREGQRGPTDQGAVRNAIVAQQNLTAALDARKDAEAAVREAVRQGLVVEAKDAVAAKFKDKQTIDLLNAAIDDEVSKVQQANAKHAESAAILAGDTAAKNDNTAATKAQTDAITDLFTVTDQLATAQDDLTQAKKDEATAQKKLDDLRKENGDAEKADAQAKLKESQNSLTDAINRRTKAQKALDELDAQDFDIKLAEAANNVTEAQISLREAIKGRDDAQKALNRTQVTDLNLSGLNLTQIRSALANARLSLAAQRSTAKTPQELQDELTTAQIGVFNAQNKVNDATTEQNKLIKEGKTGTDEHIAAVDELARSVTAVTVAQDSVKKRQGELDKILAGNSQHVKDVTAAQGDLERAIGRVNTAQSHVDDLVTRQKDDTNTILGVNQLISDEMVRQIGLHKTLFSQDAGLRRGLIENTLSTIGATINHGGGNIGPLAPNDLGQETIDKLFNDLAGNNLPAFIDLLKAIGVIIPGHALGALVTRPELSWIGENFHAESVIPWTKPDRVWEVLAQSLPHMPATVRERIEPALPNYRVSRSASTPAGPPELDYERLAGAIAAALKKEGVGADVDITVAAAPGMSEAQLARRVAREMGRYWGNP